MVRTPHYYKTSMSEDTLAEYYFRVAEAAGIPIMVYSIPIFTGVTVEASLLQASRDPSQYRGNKGQLAERVSGSGVSQEVVPESFQILVGNANTFYEALQMGACGGVLGLPTSSPKNAWEFSERTRKGTHPARQRCSKGWCRSPTKSSTPTASPA